MIPANPLNDANFLRIASKLRTSDLRRQIDAAWYEGSLYAFLEAAWPYMDTVQFKPSKHQEAICEHLEAVTRGDIKKLLINIPPRYGKTNSVSIAWPAWTWAQQMKRGNPRIGPGVRFLCASYGADKAQEDGVTTRRLIASEWYQRLWGDRYQIAKDRDNQGRYDTTRGGSRISTGIPESLGKGGMIRIIDDAHKTKEVESEITRQSVIRAYDEVWSTRSNDPTNGAEVIVMQRLAENDLSGHVLERDGWVHLCLPSRYDSRRHCSTKIGWEDWREVDGEPLWPEQDPVEALERREKEIGPYAFAGQFQQSPVARGGGIIKDDWWQLWPPADEEDSWYTTQETEDGRTVRVLGFPDLDYVLVECDTAYTEKEENDWSACCVWGVFRDRANNPKIIMMSAWRERLELHALCQKIIKTCRHFKADLLRVEAKANGISVGQEIRRLTRDGEFQLMLDAPKGDKVARVHAVVPLFTGGIVYTPDRKWSQMVINEVSQFPKGRHDDLVDCVSGGLGYLRKLGLAKLTTESETDNYDAVLFRGNRDGVAVGYGV